MRISDLHRRILAGKVFDPDAQAYINAVQFADGQSLEQGVKLAINDFVVGCKSDGIWDAIKASCILSGARTLNGALIPLKGTAPTNVNFVSGDYNRKTGLKGDGATKYLNSNRNNNADPQNNQSMSVFRTELMSAGFAVSIGAGLVSTNGTTRIAQDTATPLRANLRNRSSAFQSRDSGLQLNLSGMSRSSNLNYNFYYNGLSIILSSTSQIPYDNNIFVFATSAPDVFVSGPSDERISFYHIGEALDLSLLSARLTTLMNTYNSVI
jgi:hypothetical protein